MLHRHGTHDAAMKGSAMLRGEAAACLTGSWARRASLNASAVLLLLTLLVAGAQPVSNAPAPSPSTDLTRSDVERAFDSIIASRQALVKSLGIPQWSRSSRSPLDSPPPYDSLSAYDLLRDLFNRSVQRFVGPATLRFVGQVYGSGIEPRVTEAYKAMLRAELASPKPEYRGLACELLGLQFDPESVQALGAILDDPTPSVIQLARGQLAQTIDLSEHMRGLLHCEQATVGELASRCLGTLTGLSFASASQFRTWWQGNNDHSNHLWYWSMLWTRNHTANVIDANGDRYRNDEVIRSWPAWTSHEDEFSRVEVNTRLKVLLLHEQDQLVQREIALSMGLDPAQHGGDVPQIARSSFFNSGYPQRDYGTRFVVENGLKPRLLELLQQKQLYPEILTDGDFRILAYNILALSVFTPQDEETLAAAQSLSTPFKAYAVPVVQVRCELAPDRARAILEEALKANMSHVALANQLVARVGSQDADLLTQAFTSWSGEARYSFATSVHKAVEAGIRVAPGFIRGLITQLAPPGDFSGGKDQDSDRALAELARAANTITKTNLVTDDEITAALFPFGKIMPDEAIAGRARATPAFLALKSKLLAALAPDQNTGR